VKGFRLTLESCHGILMRKCFGMFGSFLPVKMGCLDVSCGSFLLMLKTEASELSSHLSSMSLGNFVLHKLSTTVSLILAYSSKFKS
jgi:hypothetical protein